MQYMTFEFASEAELRDVARKLWEGHGVTGEMHSRAVGGGKWRLEIASEKELRDTTLEKFASYRVETGD